MKAVKIILHLLSEFIQGRTQILSAENRKNNEITHYYYEIVRYWSKLNFIINKTLRSLEKNLHVEKELLLYTTYRVMFEKAKIQDILMEVDQNEKLLIYLKRLENFSWTIALKGKMKVEALSISEAIPSFFIERLLPVMKYSFLKKNIRMMNQYHSQNSLSLRVNSLAFNKPLKEILKLIESDLQKEGIKIKQDKEIPYILHIQAKYKSKIITSKWYRDNVLVFQDKGSAAIVGLLKPFKKEYICDLCAAPGIKSSLIMQLSNKQSRLLCNDFSKSRLQFTKAFFLNMKVLNTFLLNSDGINLPVKLGIRFDKILVDAPCTGSGTFISTPELKWRQNYAFLNQCVTIQKKLIQSSLNLLKSGGILVYSTCSLYPEEGEYQINEIYDQISPLELPEFFSPSYKINNKVLKGTGRLFPSIHNTQGFFVSRLKKK